MQLMPWLSRVEYEDFRTEVRSDVHKLEDKVEVMAKEIAGLRADVRFIAKVFTGLLLLANFADPFIIYWLGHH